MTWHRYICKSHTVTHNRKLFNEIRQMAINCCSGNRPVHNLYPFILAESLNQPFIENSMLQDIASQLNTVAQNIPQYPHLQTMWVKTGYTMHPQPTEPFLLTRVWIRQQGYGLNWLAATQIVNSSDFIILQRQKWAPYRKPSDLVLNAPRLQ
jgi:hypothetical protein